MPPVTMTDEFLVNGVDIFPSLDNPKVKKIIHQAALPVSEKFFEQRQIPTIDQLAQEKQDLVKKVEEAAARSGDQDAYQTCKAQIEENFENIAQFILKDTIRRLSQLDPKFLQSCEHNIRAVVASQKGPIAREWEAHQKRMGRALERSAMKSDEILAQIQTECTALAERLSITLKSSELEETLQGNMDEICDLVFNETSTGHKIGTGGSGVAKDDDEDEILPDANEHEIERIQQRLADRDTHYAVLNVDPSDDFNTISEAIGHLQLSLHTDKCNLAGAKECFQAIMSAKTALKDARSRNEYDSQVRIPQPDTQVQAFFVQAKPYVEHILSSFASVDELTDAFLPIEDINKALRDYVQQHWRYIPLFSYSIKSSDLEYLRILRGSTVARIATATTEHQQHRLLEKLSEDVLKYINESKRQWPVSWQEALFKPIIGAAEPVLNTNQRTLYPTISCSEPGKTRLGETILAYKIHKKKIRVTNEKYVSGYTFFVRPLFGPPLAVRSADEIGYDAARDYNAYEKRNEVDTEKDYTETDAKLERIEGIVFQHNPGRTEPYSKSCPTWIHVAIKESTDVHILTKTQFVDWQGKKFGPRIIADWCMSNGVYPPWNPKYTPSESDALLLDFPMPSQRNPLHVQHSLSNSLLLPFNDVRSNGYINPQRFTRGQINNTTYIPGGQSQQYQQNYSNEQGGQMNNTAYIPRVQQQQYQQNYSNEQGGQMNNTAYISRVQQQPYQQNYSNGPGNHPYYPEQQRFPSAPAAHIGLNETNALVNNVLVRMQDADFAEKLNRLLISAN